MRRSIRRVNFWLKNEEPISLGEESRFPVTTRFCPGKRKADQPDQTPTAWQNATNVAFHTRSRLFVIGTVEKMAPATQLHGGLSPGALCRVRECVEMRSSKTPIWQR